MQGSILARRQKNWHIFTKKKISRPEVWNSDSDVTRKKSSSDFTLNPFFTTYYYVWLHFFLKQGLLGYDAHCQLIGASSKSYWCTYFKSGIKIRKYLVLRNENFPVSKLDHYLKRHYDVDCKWASSRHEEIRLQAIEIPNIELTN